MECGTFNGDTINACRHKANSFARSAVATAMPATDTGISAKRRAVVTSCVRDAWAQALWGCEMFKEGTCIAYVDHLTLSVNRWHKPRTYHLVKLHKASFATICRWERLLSAMKVQFSDDGIHFEHDPSLD